MNFNPLIEKLHTYEPGKDIELIAKEYGLTEVIKLASNENPFGASPKAVEAIKAMAYKANLYPDDSMSELKARLAIKFGVNEKNIIIGAGSDQVIEYAVHSKLNTTNAFLQSGVTFAMYEIYAKQCGAKCYKTKSIVHNLDEFAYLYTQHRAQIKIIFLCVPNNPLGECLDSLAIKEFLRGIDKDCMVVLDGAYNEFASFKDKTKRLNPKELIAEFSNVVYLGTFSKLYGLGGLRVGYGVANEELISVFYKLRAPFNVSNIALKAAVAALDDEEFVKESLQNTFLEMQKYEEFAKKHHLKTLQSYTNFITYFFDEKNSTDLSEKLLKKGIIIRNLKSYGLNAVRITLGTPYQNKRFFEEFENILQEN
ncbi:histidinol-phosphate transaminase [Campylobacter sp. MIT 21-1685]|uniref:histidinol-phosphate transaminase n=1 Tax=unclassified Campylobacter TaxID=2593542 RepID=UPI00224AED6E|nr:MULTISPECIES: histidinol-phosphate transaminase [unclassified Campylobacter]MCX2683027.1 histidinol-phosphate transaminase [Campylobacter sp. MIT 21-1684]MCX2751309.1 histidinol-phosphate transaminase [Campylobacter sp. MIT 21-1682]MCX2807508.1 histidinol-phosphate transaminase [Campylobacter sp. MIT 21-1685]